MAITDQILNIGDGYSNALSSIGNIAGSAGSIIKKIKSLNGNEMSVGAIRDLNTNGFLAQNSLFKPNFFARAFDEPTYLSFRIEFLFNSGINRARNTAYNNNTTGEGTEVISISYPVMYDNMPEPLLDDYFISLDNGNLGDPSIGVRYSTENYLDMNLGDHGRAALLHTFKLALKDIQENFPYYFTGLSGLETLTNVEPEHGIRVGNGEITLECNEGIDLKITQLLQLYRKIVWDDVYQRWVLPDMMRYFGMKIYVSEIRLFSDVKKESDTAPEAYSFMNTGAVITDMLNMTYRGQNDNSGSLFGTIANTLNKATALSQSFLGTKNTITKALNYTSGTINTALGAFDSIMGALNQVQYCNNAINEVMPTLCFECHMCEFDIKNTLGHISSLKSSNNETQSPKPTIKIKVGQVKESQVFPLNTTLRKNSNGYYTKLLDEFNDKDALDAYNDLMQSLDNTTTMTNIDNIRSGKAMHVGNYIDDEILNKKYKNDKINERLKEYVENLSHSMIFSKMRGTRPDQTQLNQNRMNYVPDNTSQSAASSGLFATVMNEVTSIASHAGALGSTYSAATNPSNEEKTALKAIGEILNAAVDRIYNGPEMKSMAAQGVSETDRAKIANNSFEAFIRELETSTATSDNYLMKEVLKNYRVVQNEERQNK